MGRGSVKSVRYLYCTTNVYLYGICTISSRTIAVNRTVSSVKSYDIRYDIACDIWRKIVLYPMSVGRRIVPTLVRYLYREAAANKSKQSTNVPPCHPLHLPSHRETSTLSVVASLATVVKDPVLPSAHSSSGMRPRSSAPRRRLYEIVRYRELKVRCRTISVTVSGTISHVKSYDTFVNRTVYVRYLAVKSPYIGRKSDITRLTLPPPQGFDGARSTKSLDVLLSRFTQCSAVSD